MPTVLDYTAHVKHDGALYEFQFPGLEIPRCQACGETYTTRAVDERISDALRSKLHLLTPSQMQLGIDRLRLTQRELAERLAVAPEMISEWVSGNIIQSKAMDNLLRLFFALPEVRNVLRGPSQDPMLGTHFTASEVAT